MIRPEYDVSLDWKLVRLRLGLENDFRDNLVKVISIVRFCLGLKIDIRGTLVKSISILRF